MGRVHRAMLQQLARETEAIVTAGGYQADRWVELSGMLAAARRGSHMHLPGQRVSAAVPRGRTVVEVTGETTLAATLRLHDEAVACLNFASAKHPGGGWRTGARAQEESLARASGLATCLEQVPEFYGFHRDQAQPVYSDRVICSPGVPVFRDDDGRLLEEPYQVTFLTAAAPNAGALRKRDDWHGDLTEVLGRRARQILAVASAHGHRRLVLGAWGCGVFRNDPRVVAGVFADLLSTELGSAFHRVTFAVFDTRQGAPTRTAFQQVLRPLTT